MSFVRSIVLLSDRNFIRGGQYHQGYLVVLVNKAVCIDYNWPINCFADYEVEVVDIT